MMGYLERRPFPNLRIYIQAKTPLFNTLDKKTRRRKQKKESTWKAPHSAQRPDKFNKSVQPFLPTCLKPMIAANRRLKTTVSGYKIELPL